MCYVFYGYIKKSRSSVTLLVFFATKKSSFPCFLFLDSLACWGRRVAFVSMHGVRGGEVCVLRTRCLCVGVRDGSLGTCVLMGGMCILSVGFDFPLCPPCVLCFAVL